MISKEEFKKEKETLRERFGKEPADDDVRWGLLNKESIKHAKNSDWGLFRNVEFERAEIVYKRKQFKNALFFYLLICYLDLNGPNNLGGLKDDPSILRIYKPFDPKTGFTAPFIINRIKIIANKLGMTIEDIKKDFFHKDIQRTYKDLKLPLSPEDVWEKLKIELIEIINKNKLV